MVGVVQLVERQVVILNVAGSSPVTHPNRPEGILPSGFLLDQGFALTPITFRRTGFCYTTLVLTGRAAVVVFGWVIAAAVGRGNWAITPELGLSLGVRTDARLA